jgi:hypothetical protein
MCAGTGAGLQIYSNGGRGTFVTDPIIVSPAIQRVAAVVALQRVVTLAAIKHVGSAITHKAVITITAKDVFNL